VSAKAKTLWSVQKRGGTAGEKSRMRDEARVKVRVKVRA